MTFDPEQYIEDDTVVLHRDKPDVTYASTGIEGLHLEYEAAYDGDKYSHPERIVINDPIRGKTRVPIADISNEQMATVELCVEQAGWNYVERGDR